MTKFSIKINRKPWNKSAERILNECESIIKDPAFAGVTDIESFSKKLRFYFDLWCMTNAKNPEAIRISTWEINGGKRVLGINKANSVDGAAFIVKMEEEVSNG